MNISKLGLALLALFSTGAMAQTNVSIYGIVDAGLVRESGGEAGPVTNISSGVASGSRLGFKGKEDLGGGLAAVFQLESGFNIDTGASGQGGALFGRQAFVGLSGKFGAVTLGRQYTPYYKTLRDIGDPFGAVSLAGRSGNLFVTNTRANNMVEYVSPAFAGVRVDLAYAAGEVAGDSSRSRQMGGSVGYAGGPLTIQLAHHRVNNATATDTTRNTLLSGNYKFKPVTVYASYAVNKGPGPADSKDMLAGVAVPFGANKLLFSHVRHDDKTAAGRDASQWGIAYHVYLSKRTDLYAAYAVINNRNGAAFKVGNATDSGSGDKAFNLGVRHNF
ncbi:MULTISPECIES: porin [unclassified Massilia]|uniref:porin n=1 Tax=unclassified Massilia TaxID=2609279 RepID=UPI001B834F3F|nr:MULTISPECIES: porin [unclassified Massilia]MBQ5939770.1 porin [Massilia sp. AB1]MBQ5965147.1 porin [Massilia sp. ZL223]